MKILFITHAVCIYGACRSLQHVLQNYKDLVKDIEYDIIVPKRLINKNNMDKIREYCGPAVRNIYEYHLPFDQCFVGKIIEGTPLYYLSRFFKGVFWRLDRKKIYALIEKEKYDFIHLNSLVLNPLIEKKYPFIVHVRDLDDGSSKSAREKIKDVCGVVFIDEAVKKPFSSLQLKNSIVLNNPFDMTILESYKGDGQKVLKNVDPNKNVIFSLLGRIKDAKGTGFVINSFIKVKNVNARLLIVGREEGSYFKKCVNLAKNDKRIVFHGEEAEIYKVYYISDYVIRGDVCPAVGRTIYEGLYAGCKIIMPGKETKVVLDEYDKFKESIFFYKTRDVEDLSELFESLSDKKVSKGKYYSNVDAYIEKFHNFVLRSCKR
ncbi:hypothetical protein ACFL31_01615 [Candidatus Margulisiibacteriota bacterium]